MGKDVHSSSPNHDNGEGRSSPPTHVNGTWTTPVPVFVEDTSEEEFAPTQPAPTPQTSSTTSTQQHLTATVPAGGGGAGGGSIRRESVGSRTSSHQSRERVPTGTATSRD